MILADPPGLRIEGEVNLIDDPGALGSGLFGPTCHAFALRNESATSTQNSLEMPRV